MALKSGRTTGSAFVMAILMLGPWGYAVPPAWSEEEPRQRVVIEMKEYTYSPKKIVLHAGTETELVLVNRGKYLHEFEIPYLQEMEVDIQMPKVLIETLGVPEIEVKPGGKVVLRFIPEATGEFPFSCHAKEPKDHYQEEMTGTLIVKEDEVKNR